MTPNSLLSAADTLTRVLSSTVPRSAPPAPREQPRAPGYLHGLDLYAAEPYTALASVRTVAETAPANRRARAAEREAPWLGYKVAAAVVGGVLIWLSRRVSFSSTRRGRK